MHVPDIFTSAPLISASCFYCLQDSLSICSSLSVDSPVSEGHHGSTPIYNTCVCTSPTNAHLGACLNTPDCRPNAEVLLSEYYGYCLSTGSFVEEFCMQNKDAGGNIGEVVKQYCVEGKFRTISSTVTKAGTTPGVPLYTPEPKDKARIQELTTTYTTGTTTTVTRTHTHMISGRHTSPTGSVKPAMRISPHTQAEGGAPGYYTLSTTGVAVIVLAALAMLR